MSARKVVSVVLVLALPMAGLAVHAQQGKPRKITICHVAKKGSSTIEINEDRWPEHQAHGDTLGGCTVSPTS
jgi:hypothetical protein